jgi:four helix bundle protein
MDDALLNLDVWRRSRKLAVNVYASLRHCRDRGFMDQITRAAISIPSNTAEGYERNSPRDFANFLRIARGSCAELRTQLNIGDEIGLIDPTTAKDLQGEALELSKMIQGLINRCKRRLRT